MRRRFRVVGMARDNMARDAMALSSDFDDVIIDGPRSEPVHDIESPCGELERISDG
jgi:hypothetical protein